MLLGSEAEEQLFAGSLDAAEQAAGRPVPLVFINAN
jgi:hypothetical protein